MIQVQSALAVEFAKKIGTSSLSQKILHGLAGYPLKPVKEEGVRLKLPPNKVSIIWHPDMCDIRSEDLKDAQASLKTILNTLSEINKIVAIDQLSTRRLITYWILPTPKYTLKELGDVYRQEMVTEHSHFDGSYDFSVLLDIERGGTRLHHQSGPMERKQLLEEYLRYGLKDVPRSFLFLEAAVVDPKAVKYSFDEMSSFVLNSFSYCEAHSKEFERIWGGKL